MGKGNVKTEYYQISSRQELLEPFGCFIGVKESYRRKPTPGKPLAFAAKNWWEDTPPLTSPRDPGNERALGA